MMGRPLWSLSVEAYCRFAHEQGVTAKKLTPDELCT